MKIKDTRKKPVNYNFNHLNPRLIENVLSGFGFENEFISLPFMGRGSNIKTIFFQSETANKALVRCGNNFFFIKEIPWYLSDEKQIKVIYNKNYYLLHTVSDKIPILYKSKKNGNYFFEINNRYYLLMDYIEGSEWDNTGRQAYSVGSELARIHKTLISPGKNRSRYYRSISSSALDMIKLARKDFLIKNLKIYNNELNDYKKTCSVVYGDSNPSNYLFDASGLKAIVDFDNLKYDNPVRDLAETIISFAIVKYRYNTSSFEKIINPINHEVALSIIDGYKQGLGDEVLFDRISSNLVASIKIMLLLFYSLAFLKDSKYNEAFNMEILDFDIIRDIIKK